MLFDPKCRNIGRKYLPTHILHRSVSNLNGLGHVFEDPPVGTLFHTAILLVAKPQDHAFHRSPRLVQDELRSLSSLFWNCAVVDNCVFLISIVLRSWSASISLSSVVLAILYFLDSSVPEQLPLTALIWVSTALNLGLPFF